MERIIWIIYNLSQKIEDERILFKSFYDIITILSKPDRNIQKDKTTDQYSS